MLSALKSLMIKSNLDSFLFIGDSVCDSDMYYLSHFLSQDRFTLLAQDDITLLVSSMEMGRAGKESIAKEIVSTSDYRIMEKLKVSGRPDQAYLQVLREFLRDRGARRIGIPFRFPAGIHQHLAEDFEISILESPLARQRAVKTAEELAAIRMAQRGCEKAMRQAVNLIAASEPQGDYLLRQGRPLTSEDVRSTIEIALLEEGCEAVDTIVAGGASAADPHSRGTGPLPANEPIVIDIFPRSKSLRYFADMTRTVVRGEASLEVKEIYEAVLAAQSAGLKCISSGVSGKEVHSRVVDIFKEHGYPEQDRTGFTHSTGHGVGLNIHERPSLSEAGDLLEANNVVTVEPGLYYPEIGGVRLEDLVVVTAKGCENLTNFVKKLII
jgi:Xaa-Pro aminopeptidase